MTDPNASDLLSSAEARRVAGGVGLCTIWRWTKAGTIPAPIKIRGRNYWKRGEFEAALMGAAQQEVGHE